VSGATVIVVHGLWMTGVECAMLRRRLAAAGFAPRQFHYHSVSEPALTVLARLRSEIESAALEGAVHLVGHSLGGLLVLRLLSTPPRLTVARAVLLGSPVRGSRAARTLNEWPGANWLLGDLAEAELVQTIDRAWQGQGDLGVIAGTAGLGLGRLFTQFAEPSDGTVSLSETELPGATDRRVLPVSHLGMLLSEDVADEVAHFLDHGRFSGAQR
jgi:pimeloyl-ACP methyl ester carboxylesterase